MKKAFLLIGLICLLASASFAYIPFGSTTADLDSVTSSKATIRWNESVVKPVPQSTQLTSDQIAHVYWKVRDDSRLVGYANKVSVTVEEYNFSTWSWQAGGTNYSHTGPNTRTGKYDNSGTWDIYLLQTHPVSKYKVTMVAETKGDSKTESREFYLHKIPPAGSRTADQKAAAANWIASRRELALIFRSMRNTWVSLRNNSQNFNYSQEMAKVIVSCGQLFGPTTTSDYIIDSGLEFLSVASEAFGKTTIAALAETGGVIKQAYDWGKWASSTLSSSQQLWNNVMNGFIMQSAANACGTALEYSLNDLVNALIDEANEAERLIYTSPYDDPTAWSNKLTFEKNKFDAVATAATSAQTTPSTILSYADQATRDDYQNFLETIRKLALAQKDILAAAGR